MAVAGDDLTVWFVIRRLDVGGAQRQVATLAAALQARGTAPVVFTLHPGGPFVDSLRAQDVTVWSASGPRPVRVVRLAWALITRARREQPDVVHGYLPGQNVLLALLRPLLPHRTRLVWGVRVARVLHHTYSPTGRALYALQRRLRRVPDAIVANAQATADLLGAAGYPAARIHVVPNGVDTDAFHPDPEARREQRRAWGWDDEHLGVGLVGRLDPVKDHPLFLAAAAELAADPQLRFACVGDGPPVLRDDLARQASSLGLDSVLTWAGEVADMRAAYSALDVVCLTSTHEALPNVLLEAMACGTPCVTVAVGDAAEVVGPTGVVVAERSPAAVAAACQALLRRRQEEPDLSARVVADVRRRYDEAQLVERTLAVLATLTR